MDLILLSGLFLFTHSPLEKPISSMMNKPSGRKKELRLVTVYDGN